MTTDLAAITLAKGGHGEPSADCGNPQRCLFEWYNWLTRAEHTDSRPPGVSRVLHTFGMRLNDVLPDGRRQELKRFLPNGSDRLAGTADDGKDETRGYIALDWLIRTWTPAWLDLGGLPAEATALRDLRRIADLVAAQTAGPVVREADSKADAARDAARDAAGDAAGDAAWAAAWDAAWDAARDAAWDAAWDAAGDAAWDAAWDAAGDAAGAAAWDAAGAAAWDAAGAAARAAAWDAAGDAARAAARDAAGAAAWDAAGDAARAAARDAAGDAARDAARAAARAAARDAAGDAARDAARAAARDKLAPTAAELQTSAIALYDVLITGEWPS